MTNPPTRAQPRSMGMEESETNRVMSWTRKTSVKEGKIRSCQRRLFPLFVSKRLGLTTESSEHEDHPGNNGSTEASSKGSDARSEEVRPTGLILLVETLRQPLTSWDGEEVTRDVSEIVEGESSFVSGVEERDEMEEEGLDDERSRGCSREFLTRREKRTELQLQRDGSGNMNETEDSPGTSGEVETASELSRVSEGRRWRKRRWLWGRRLRRIEVRRQRAIEAQRLQRGPWRERRRW